MQKLVLVITSLETNDVLERWQFDIECDKSAKQSRRVTDFSSSGIVDWQRGGFLLAYLLHLLQPFISFKIPFLHYAGVWLNKKGLGWRDSGVESVLMLEFSSVCYLLPSPARRSADVHTAVCSNCPQHSHVHSALASFAVLPGKNPSRPFRMRSARSSDRLQPQ